MSRRFIPPAVAAFGDGPDADMARGVAQARDDGFAEGRAFGQREGHAAGQREGEDAARTAHEAELAALHERFAKHQSVLAVTDALEQVLAARFNDLRAVEDNTRIALSAVLQALFPTLLRHSAGQEIAALLAEALTERATETLALRAHPATLQAVAEQGFPGRHAAQLTMQPDPAMAEVRRDRLVLRRTDLRPGSAARARGRYPVALEPCRKGNRRMSDQPDTAQGVLIAEDRLASVMDIPVTLTVVLGERDSRWASSTRSAAARSSNWTSAWASRWTSSSTTASWRAVRCSLARMAGWRCR